MRLLALIGVAFAACASLAQTGYSRVRLYVPDADAVQRVCDSPLGLYSEDVIVGETDVVVAPDQWGVLFTLRIPYSFVAKLPDVSRWKGEGFEDSDFHTKYIRYNDIIAVYENWRSQRPGQITRTQVATTWEGRPVWVYKFVVSRRTVPGAPPRKKFLVTNGIHAREWISPAVGMYMFEKLIQLSETSASHARLFDKFEFHWVPSLNPDGYEHSWNVYRLWRKNRRVNGSSFGVDLNRNWAKGWGGPGSSGSPSSDTYRGPSAFSEPETNGVRNYANQIGAIVGYIDYHSYAQKILYAWSYTTNPPAEPWRTHMINIGSSYRQAILNAGGVTYQYGQGSVALYVASGTTKDWFHDTFQALSFTVEVRDTGNYGFELPPDQIVPTGAENWAGFNAFLNYLASI
jgi:murein tripeptide amidase MpaA